LTWINFGAVRSAAESHTRCKDNFAIGREHPENRCLIPLVQTHIKHWDAARSGIAAAETMPAECAARAKEYKVEGDAAEGSQFRPLIGKAASVAW